MREQIHTICDELGTSSPKIGEYANCISVAFRNNHGERVLITLDHNASPAQIREKIAYVHKVQAGAQLSEDAKAKLQRMRDQPVKIIPLSE